MKLTYVHHCVVHALVLPPIFLLVQNGTYHSEPSCNGKNEHEFQWYYGFMTPSQIACIYPNGNVTFIFQSCSSHIALQLLSSVNIVPW